MEKYQEILKKVKKMFKKARNSHDMEHTIRVYKLCMHIGKIENADMDILTLSALLHDIGRVKQDESMGKICHAEIGAKIARKIMKKNEITEEIVEKVIHCIETHRYRGQKIPESLEAKVLYDADKLDAIGAIGLARAFVFAGEIGAKVHNRNIEIEKTKSYTEEDTAYREFLVKLRYIKDKVMTVEGKRLAEERHEFMERFFERLNKETDAEI